MKNKIQPIIIVLLLIFIWLKGCNGSEIPNKSNNHQITVPAITGKFEPKTDIIHEPIKLPSKENVSLINKGKDGKTLYNHNDTKLKNYIAQLYKENEALKLNYIDADSLQRELMYLKSIQLNEFYQEYEDENLYLLAKGMLSGSELKQLGFNYEIKKRDIPIPEVKFRMLVGGGVGNSINFDKPLFKANIGFQNAKGNILRASFDTENRIMLEYDFSLFKIKKP